MQKFCIYICIVGLAIGCAKDNADTLADAELLVVPEGFPAVDFPEDNPLTLAAYDLGKKLFFDPALSRDSTVSCASCHQQSKAFADHLPFSLGAGGALGTRNAPTLANVAYHPYFTSEGGVPTLEMQVLVPIQEHNEFDFNIVLISERLSEDPAYVSMAQKAFDRGIDPYAITRAIATYERTLISGNSLYDQVHFQGELSAMSQEAQSGLDLFFSDSLACSSCHSGFNFTNYAFENNGLYSDYLDNGRYRLTGLEEDRARFKVPTLRNVEMTAPYMHDGSFTSLEEVIDHYASGGMDHPNKSELLQGFHISEKQKKDLVAFLKSLTDESFLANPNHNIQ